MRLGLIGLFGFGRKLTAALERVDGLDIAWGYHPDAGRARSWDARRGTSDLASALTDDAVPAVLIASPTPHHAEQILACLAAGKAVFVEKPLAMTAAECDQVLDAAEAAPELVGMVGHNLRRSAAARAIAKAVAEGRLGRLVTIQLTLSHGGAWNFRMDNWRGHEQWHREGPLNTAGIHLFDLVHAWAGPVRSATALIRNLAGVTEAPDVGAAMLELESGAVALINTDYIVPSEERFVIIGTEGIITWSRGELWLRQGRDVNRVPSEPEQVACEPVDMLAEELEEFCGAVGKGDPGMVETPFSTGAAAVYVLEACYRSAMERRTIALAEYTRYRAVVGQGAAAGASAQ